MTNFDIALDYQRHREASRALSRGDSVVPATSNYGLPTLLYAPACATRPSHSRASEPEATEVIYIDDLSDSVGRNDCSLANNDAQLELFWK